MGTDSEISVTKSCEEEKHLSKMKTATYEQDQIMQIWKRWCAKGQK